MQILPTRSLTVTSAGLDLLHATRLKLACSMLLAERLDARQVPWPCVAPDLLVASEDDAEGAAALGMAWQQGVPTLRIGRGQQPGPGALPHGASVRDLNEALRRLVDTRPGARVQAFPQPAEPLLLSAMRGSAPTTGIQLLARGGLHIAVDPRARRVSLPAGVSLAVMVDQLDGQAWSASTVDTSTFEHQYAYRLPQVYSFESVYLCIAQARPALLPAVDGRDLQLRHWPDVLPDELPAQWLLPIAHLHHRRWRARPLAEACDVPVRAVEALFAALLASGLDAPLDNAPPAPRHRPDREPRLLGWLARRFGLTLSRGGTA